MKFLHALPFLLWSLGVQALEPGQAGTLAQAAPLPRATYLEATGGLILVLLLIFGLGWVVKRLGMVPGNKGMVRILGGVSLGGRERALILEAEGRRVLVGVAPGQVNLLMRLDDSGPASQAESKAKTSPAQPFAKTLAEAQERLETGTEPEAGAQDKGT